MMEELHVFATAANSKSFSEAARDLGLLPSSLSRRISALEQRLGTTLFVRTTRSLRLTEAGAAYLHSVKRVLVELQDGQSAIAGLRTTVSGTLTVRSQADIGVHFIVPLLPILQSQFPELKIDLRLGHLPAERNRAPDIVATSDAPVSSEYAASKLCHTRYVAVASPSYLKRHGTPRRPDDLSRHDCVPLAALDRSPNWQFEGQECTETLLPRSRFSSNDPHAVLSAAVAGMGIAVLSDWFVARHVEEGRLLRLLDDYKITTSSIYEHPIYLVYRRCVRDVGKIRAFIECALRTHGAALIDLPRDDLVWHAAAMGAGPKRLWSRPVP